jgi:hypothetical protein
MLDEGRTRPVLGQRHRLPERCVGAVAATPLSGVVDLALVTLGVPMVVALDVDGLLLGVPDAAAEAVVAVCDEAGAPVGGSGGALGADHLIVIPS